MRKLIPFWLMCMAIFGTHIATSFFLQPNMRDDAFWGYHIFFIAYSSGSLLGLHKVKKVDPNRVGMGFLATSVFRMLASAGYLLIRLNDFSGDKMVVIAHFFIPFFLYLIAEVIMVLGMLKPTANS
jgi:hypothetical protein